jgi:hypothetical protein
MGGQEERAGGVLVSEAWDRLMEERIPRFALVVASASPGDSVLRVDAEWADYAGFLALIPRTGEVIRIERGEYDRIVVDRGIGCYPAEVNAGDEILLLGLPPDPE